MGLWNIVRDNVDPGKGGRKLSIVDQLARFSVEINYSG